MSDLTAKVALITGGASGIGAATARRLSARGASVLVVDVDAPAAADPGCEYLHGDVSLPSTWDDVVAIVRERFGGLDYVHLNAAVPTGWYPIDIFSADLSAYNRTMRVNCDGVFLGLRACVPELERRGGGSVVVTSSTGGVWPMPIDPIYAMTKHAVVGLVRSLVEELHGRGVRINAVCPGPTETGILERAYESRRDRPPLSWQSPDAVAAMVTSLLESSTSNGEFHLVIDEVATVVEFPVPRHVVR